MNVECNHGFTLIELLTALLVLSLLALMAYRGLGVVMASRDHIQAESARWRTVESFFARFERDARLAAPRPVRRGADTAPAWLGRATAVRAPLLEFTRFAGTADGDTPYRVGYGLNDAHQVELWVWPGLDLDSNPRPVRYAVLDHVLRLNFQYLSPGLTWSRTWPTVPGDPPLPLAVRLRVELGSGESVVRVFALRS